MDKQILLEDDGNHKPDLELGEDPNGTDRKQLYDAAARGVVNAASTILLRNINLVNQSVDIETGDTALHVAVKKRHPEFIATFLYYYAKVETNVEEKTPLCVAVETGDLSIVKLFTTGDKATPYKGCFSHRAIDGLTPLSRAVRLGNFEIAIHLYESGKDCLQPSDVIDIFLTCVTFGFLDLCLLILEDGVCADDIHWDCARRCPNEETALHMLAKSASLFTETESEVQALTLLKELGWQLATRSQSELRDIIRHPTNIIIDAANAENYKFLEVIIESHPHLFWETDKGLTLFHIGVSKHNLDMVNLIHKIHSSVSIMLDEDKNGDNILHRAAALPCVHNLGDVGQLQHELLFFEEMEKIVGPALRNRRNKENKTPTDIFTQKHQIWAMKAGKNLKIKVAHCFGVCTLILSILFGLTSMPTTTCTNKFIVQILPLVLKATSVIFGLISASIFFSLLMVSYQLADFRRALHLKFTVGFVSLVVAMVSLMLYYSDILYVIYCSDYGPLVHDFEDVVRVFAFNLAVLLSLIILFLHVICPSFHAIFSPTATLLKKR